MAPILCGENKSTHVGRGDAIVMKAATAPQRVKGNSTGLTVRAGESDSKGRGEHRKEMPLLNLNLQEAAPPAATT